MPPSDKKPRGLTRTQASLAGCAILVMWLSGLLAWYFALCWLAILGYQWLRKQPDSAPGPTTSSPPMAEIQPADSSLSLYHSVAPPSTAPLPSADSVGILDAAASDSSKKRRKPDRAAQFSSGGITLPHTFSFDYCTADGDDYALREVEVRSVSTKNRHTYLEGYCHDQQGERTFRTSRILGDLTDMETGELIPVKRLLAVVREREAMTYQAATPSQSRSGQERQAAKSPSTRAWQTAVFFAGFRGGKLDELEGLADAAGWQVRGTISHTVDYVVRNGSAGKKQLAEAENLGIAVIDEDAFRLLL